MTECVWLTNHEGIDSYGPWDTRILQRVIPRAGVGMGTLNVASIPERLHGQAAVVIVPARHHTSDADIEWLNGELAKLSGAVLILVGDEEAKFPWRKVQHDNLRWWVQMPDTAHHGPMRGWAFFFGNGPAVWDRGHNIEKDTLWYFAGQVTNPPRKRAVNGLRRAMERVPGFLRPTEGFGKGAPPRSYMDGLAAAWIAPAPGGPCHVDTFRFYEALQVGCIPIVDGLEADGTVTTYWEMVYGPDFPFPQVQDWDGVGGVMEQMLDARSELSARASSWWSVQKHKMVVQMRADVKAVGGSVEGSDDHLITRRGTAIVTTSPVPSNPSTDIIMETLRSIPPGFDIVIVADGVRPEQSHMAHDYWEFLRALFREVQCPVVVAPRWLHQANATKLALDLVDTPLILFMEHDTPLVDDELIDWNGAIEAVGGGHLDVLRFHHEALVLPEHEHLMVDHSTKELLGLPVRRTVQWSQRPHLARTDYYRRILDEHFTPASRTMIEDKMHSVCQAEPYDRNRLAIYHPSSGNIKRSYHLDARGLEPKFPMVY